MEWKFSTKSTTSNFFFCSSWFFLLLTKIIICMNKFNRFIWHIRINTEWIKMGYMMTSNLFYSTHTHKIVIFDGAKGGIGHVDEFQNSQSTWNYIWPIWMRSIRVQLHIWYFVFFRIGNLIILMAFWFYSSRREPNNQLKDGCTTQRRKERFNQCFVVCCACLNKIIFFDLFHFW